MVDVYLNLFQEFDKRNETWLLATDIGINTDALENSYDFPSLCNYLDFFNLLTYDLFGPWDTITGHHTSLYDDPKMGTLTNSLVS